MHKANLIVLILIGIAWVCLIVSFGTYWYYGSTKSNDSSVRFSSFYDHEKAKSTSTDANGNKYSTTSTYTSSFIDANKNFVNIFKASLSFSILAWIVLTATMLLIILSLLSVKIPILPIALITKLLPIVALVFMVLSIFIFVGLGDAMYRDCKNNSLDSVCQSQKDNGAYDFTVTNRDAGNNSKLNRGPYIGWSAIVISAAFTIGAALLGCTSASY